MMDRADHRPPERGTADVERKRVLVVDDDLPLRGMRSSVLRRHGFQVFLAGDGDEAQRALVLHQPHVVSSRFPILCFFRALAEKLEFRSSLIPVFSQHFSMRLRAES